MCQWLASAIFESFSPTSEAPSSLHAVGGVAPSDDASHAQPHPASLGLGPSFDPKPPLVGLSSASRVETRIETASEPSREFEKDKTHFVISNLQADPVPQDGTAEDAEAEDGSSDIPFRPELWEQGFAIAGRVGTY